MAGDIARGPVITVRYHGPTDHRGSRWIAHADRPGGRIVVPYSYEMDAGMDNARTAADALVERWNASDMQSPGVAWAIVAGGWTVAGDYAFIATLTYPEGLA